MEKLALSSLGMAWMMGRKCAQERYHPFHPQETP